MMNAFQINPGPCGRTFFRLCFSLSGTSCVDSNWLSVILTSLPENANPALSLPWKGLVHTGQPICFFTHCHAPVGNACDRHTYYLCLHPAIACLPDRLSSHKSEHVMCSTSTRCSNEWESTNGVYPCHYTSYINGYVTYCQEFISLFANFFVRISLSNYYLLSRQFNRIMYTIAERPAGWIVHQSGSDKSGESYRDGLYPAKVEVEGLFSRTALSFRKLISFTFYLYCCVR